MGYMGEKRLPGSNKAKKPSFNFFFLPFSPEYTQPRLLITEVKTAGSSFSTQQTAPEVSFQLMLIAFKQGKKKSKFQARFYLSKHRNRALEFETSTDERVMKGWNGRSSSHHHEMH